MPIWIRWRIDSDRGTVLQGLQEWPRGDVKRGMTRGNVRSGSKAEPAASAPSGGLSDRQIEGGHYQVECDELQGKRQRINLWLVTALRPHTMFRRPSKRRSRP